MSTAEIADNKWEVQASKPPVATAGGLAQLLMFLGFVVLFAYLTAMSIIGAVTPKNEENAIEKQFSSTPAATPATPEKAQ
jgi:hypothetical protein